MSDTRRGFLAKIGAMATAPVVTAFVPDEATGLAVPDRSIAVAKAVPPPMVISSLTAPTPGFRPDEEMIAPHGMIHRWINGGPWQIPAWRGAGGAMGRTRP
jgi:hypothetical protein